MNSVINTVVIVNLMVDAAPWWLMPHHKIYAAAVVG